MIKNQDQGQVESAARVPHNFRRSNEVDHEVGFASLEARSLNAIYGIQWMRSFEGAMSS